MTYLPRARYLQQCRLPCPHPPGPLSPVSTEGGSAGGVCPNPSHGEPAQARFCLCFLSAVWPGANPSPSLDGGVGTGQCVDREGWVNGDGIISSQVARQLQEALLRSRRLGSVANWHS